MKKLVLLAFAILIGNVVVFAQRPYNPSEMSKPYYLSSKFISINGGLYFFQPQRTISVPIFLNPSIIVTRNIEVGLHVIYYRYKHYVEYESDLQPIIPDQTFYPSDQDKFTHIFIGVKGAYHLSDVLLRYAKINMPKKLDPYGLFMIGYNMNSVSSDADTPSNKDYEDSRARVGFGIGIRYIRTKRIGIFTEFGVNDYGYGTLGLTYFVTK